MATVRFTLHPQAMRTLANRMEATYLDPHASGPRQLLRELRRAAGRPGRTAEVGGDEIQALCEPARLHLQTPATRRVLLDALRRWQEADAEDRDSRARRMAAHPQRPRA